MTPDEKRLCTFLFVFVALVGGWVGMSGLLLRTEMWAFYGLLVFSLAIGVVVTLPEE